MISAVEILQKYWGFTKFRSPQAEIINEVVNQRDVITLLPTGLGKSVCFQVPTLMSEQRVCIVISPLIALMKDQVESLHKKGVKAIALIGSIPQNELIRVFDNLQFGGIRFLYLSPERLQSSFIQEKIKQLTVSLIAIDEAHCISEWGHDFRPSYLNIKILRELQPKTNIIALTATATQRVINDISKYLVLENPILFQKSLIRTNLHLQVIKSADKLGNLLNLIHPIKEPIIVYAGSRKNCQRTSEYLKNNGVKSVYYHAGLSKEVKDVAFSEWYNEKAQVMVATNAFGMGIDKTNVRMVIHISIPYSIENYVQEAGRAGRDGKKSYAVIIEETEAIKKNSSQYAKAIPGVTFIKKLYNHLNQYFRITYGSLSEQIFSFQLTDFCQQYQLPILKTYNGLELLEREGILKQNSYSRHLSQLVFTASSEQLFSYYQRNPIKEKILKTMLRTYDGIFESFCVINTDKIAKKINLKVKELENQLNEIQRDGYINYQSNKYANTLQFLKPREDAYTINNIIKSIEQQQKIKQKKYDSMLSYIVTNDICRNRQLREYFNEENISDCNICDVCENKVNKKYVDDKNIRLAILKSLEKGALSSKEITKKIKRLDEDVLKSIRTLLDRDTIVLTSHNKYKLHE